MSSTRRAVIDIGTNSVKLLVADVTPDDIQPVLEMGEQTRLGQGSYRSHQLQPDAIARTASTVAQFAHRAREEDAGEVRVFATSAAREASNSEELERAVREQAGLDLTIIGGDTEAEWAFRGATNTPQLAHAALLLLDVGGGSTEFILGCRHERHFSRSFPMGTVRTLDAVSHSDPPTAEERERCRDHIRNFLQSEVEPALAAPLRRERAAATDHHVRLVGTGGTACILAAIELEVPLSERERIEGKRLTPEVLEACVDKLWSLPLAQRRQLPGLPPERADVMLTGAVIFEQVVKLLEFPELQVSTRGLRFAALTELWQP